MRAVDAVMECLKAEGVDVVFGLPGGANLPTYDAFVDAGIHHVLVRHEAGGGHAAQGYAKATGKVGVALGTSGPGATNLITPITDAMMDSCATVFITGQVRTELLGTDGFQEADTIGITMPIVKHSFMIQHPLEIPRAIHEAFHLARSGRPGLVMNVPFKSGMIGTFDTQLAHEFFQGFVNHAFVTLHIDNLKGENAHHQCETVFKAFARALRSAAELDPRAAGTIPSTKGSL